MHVHREERATVPGGESGSHPCGGDLRRQQPLHPTGHPAHGGPRQVRRVEAPRSRCHLRAVVIPRALAIRSTPTRPLKHHFPGCRAGQLRHCVGPRQVSGVVLKLRNANHVCRQWPGFCTDHADPLFRVRLVQERQGRGRIRNENGGRANIGRLNRAVESADHVDQREKRQVDGMLTAMSRLRHCRECNDSLQVLFGDAPEEKRFSLHGRDLFDSRGTNRVLSRVCHGRSDFGPIWAAWQYRKSWKWFKIIEA